MPYSAKKLWDHHRQICRLLIASNGKYTNKEIAEMVGCSPQTVSNVRNSPLGMAKINTLHEESDRKAVEISKQVKEIAPDAIALLKKSIDVTSKTVDEAGSDIDTKLLRAGQMAAKTVLETAIPKKVEGEVLHGHVTLEQILQMKKRLYNIREVSGTVEEVADAS